MNLDGELRLHVGLRERPGGVRVVSAGVSSTRPHLASRVFAGRAVGEVAAMVPRLFSVCGRAQGIASALACEAASGAQAPAAVSEARKLLAGVESFHEGVWRILLDWPRMLGSEPSVKEFAAAHSALDATTARVGGAAGLAPVPPGEESVAAAGQSARAVAGDVLSRHVLGTTHERWDVLGSVDELADWADSRHTPAADMVARMHGQDATLGASEVPLLPRVDSNAALRTLATAIEADAQFARAPHWNSRPAETGPLARMHAHPLVAALVSRFGRSAFARFVARLAELCSFAAGASPQIGCSGLEPGCGIGWVETSRGLLLHYAELDGSRVRTYRIVAPTEWNFHPQGALPRGLEGGEYQTEDALRRAVSLLVQSLDPCVAWTMEVAHA